MGAHHFGSSLASKTKWFTRSVLQIHPPSQALEMSDKISRPPDEVPACYEAARAKITRQMKRILDLKATPYYIQANLADEGFVTLEDLVDCWKTAEDARKDGPKELKLESGANDYTPELERLCSRRLYQAAKLAKSFLSGTAAMGAESRSLTQVLATSLDLACDRAQLEIQYQLKTNSGRPLLEDQGSDEETIQILSKRWHWLRWISPDSVLSTRTWRTPS